LSLAFNIELFAISRAAATDTDTDADTAIATATDTDSGRDADIDSEIHFDSHSSGWFMAAQCVCKWYVV